MVVIIYGTTGELIKLWPLLELMDPEKYFTICTHQQPEQLNILREAAKIPDPDVRIGSPETGSDIDGFSPIPLWFTRVWLGFFSNRQAIGKNIAPTIAKSNGSNRSNGKPHRLVLVHGDTPTTILGSIMGRLLGLPVAHIEAGLRSDSWRHPFPEELIRARTSRLARLHFAPGDGAVDNLRRTNAKGQIVNTRYNTVLDSLQLAQSQNGNPTRSQLPGHLPDKYCIVSIHRTELLQSKELKYILGRIRSAANSVPIIFIDHPITRERLRYLHLDDALEHRNIRRIPKQCYLDFIPLLTKAECVVTDSGGLQEEAAYLGIPCLVHRRATERTEGLGENVVLSHYDHQVVDEFFIDYKRYGRERVSQGVSPSRIILGALEANGYI